MTLPILVMSGSSTPSELETASYPVYRLAWAGETDRWFIGENMPIRWNLTRADGAECETPESAALVITDSAGEEVQTLTLDLDGTSTQWTLAQLLELETAGLYAARLVVGLPDDVRVASQRDIYAI